MTILDDMQEKIVEREKKMSTEKLDGIFQEVMTTGKEIEQRKTEKEHEMEEASSAVAAAAVEMENAALIGDEEAYAQAKDRYAKAQNRLEILQIRKKNNVDNEDFAKEVFVLMRNTQDECLEEMKKLGRVFLDQYDSLIKTVNTICDYSIRYSKVIDYLKAYVLKSNTFPFKYMSELFPVAHVKTIKEKFQFQRNQIEKMIDQ